MTSEQAVNPVGQKVWIMAGESSGDTYGAWLAKSLRIIEPDVTIEGMGGIEMGRAEVKLLADTTELGVVGLVEVLRRYPTFRRLFDGLVALAAQERPDVVVLIDYPGFNLRFAKKMHKLGIPVVYYICPQVWAWGKKRIPVLGEVSARILVIFPFETETFAEQGVSAEFVGHPLLEVLDVDTAEVVARDPNLIALLPGSRDSEVSRLLTPMLETARLLFATNSDRRFVIPLPRESMAESVRERLERWRQKTGATFPVTVTSEDTIVLLRRSAAGLAASGTITVQSAILALPLVVVYRMNPITWFIGRRLVDVPFVAMPNLILGRRLYEEFLQGDVRPELLAPAIERILPGGERHGEVEIGMGKVAEELGGAMPASRRAAECIRDVLLETAD